MLHEITKTQTKDGNRYRRWFTCEVFDLYVWTNSEAVFEKFQLCLKSEYSVSPEDEMREDVLTWEEGGGYSFDKVLYTQRYSTPILEKTEPFDIDLLKLRFSKLSLNIEENIREFVSRKLSEIETA